MAPAAPSTTTTTPAPPLVAARTAVPLTTIWTPPASCVTPIPVVEGGTCRSSTTGCSWYSSNAVTTTRADVNFPFMTGPWSYASDSCVPPGWNTQSYLSPAAGCPAGYVTGWTGRGLLATLTSLACCPSDFSSYNVYSGCMGTTRVSPGQTYYLRAQGTNTVTTVETQSGVRTTLRAPVVTQSSTLTRTYTASALLTVIAPPVLLVRDAAMAQDQLAGTAFGTTATTGFSIFSLSTVVSIVASVGIGVGCLIVFCCACYCCIRSRRRRRRTRGWNNNPWPAPAPVIHNPRARPAPRRRSTPVSSPPRSPPPAVTPSPTQPPIVLFNLPRQPATSGPVTKPIERLKCQTCQRNCHATAKTRDNGCCSCRDIRTTLQDAMPMKERISTYCRPCRDRWTRLGPASCPASWHLDLVGCKHGLGKTCSRSPSKFETASCCLCDDRRTGLLSLDLPGMTASPQGSSSRNFSTWLDEASIRGDRTVSSSGQPQEERGLPREEKGLCRGTPSFSVLPTVSASPAPVEGPQTLRRRQGEPSRTISRFGSAEWRREQDRRGLQFNKPQFDVLPEA
ncbi:hypothetical protein MAPG_06973 [Magnaporthiopsis poae ATCC 64411]|uniref:Uncharacterized protein n=1 Tax=Magnaporthiopsis poae (strain ATCC 64411 / 73-15) TaxID=644358 RepID=A0A0C4E3H4_MAGP6|nr:hypothetical protein MAPG_06973 [Magnaporthiopsis poae ATCC 64411]